MNGKEKIEEKEKRKFDVSSWYDRNYKKLLFLSLALLFASVIYIAVFYFFHHDFMHKDVSLTGGTSITVYVEKPINTRELENFLEKELNKPTSIRTLQDITARKTIAVVIETTADSEEAKRAIEKFLGFELTQENSSIEISGPTLSKSFYKQLIIAVILAFFFMAIVVFIIFRTAIPSLAVILAALTDLLGSLALCNALNFRIGTAGIAAFLMLIGYSVDTDIMLTTKVIKRRGESALNERLASAAKTGLSMTLTSFVAVLTAYFIVQSTVLKQIFFILSAGLFFDLISTWFGNASILKWYCEKKGLK